MCFKKILGWFKKSKDHETKVLEDKDNDLFKEKDQEIKLDDEASASTEDFNPLSSEEATTDEAYVVKPEDKIINVYAPCDGQVKEMRFIQDPVFKQNLLGEGLFITPEYPKEAEKLAFFSPVKGEIVNLFHIGHYYTIREKFLDSEHYQDFIIHIGVDSVEAGEEAFDKKVNTGDQVSNDTMLCEININKLLESASSMDTPILVSAETLANCKIINKKTGKVKQGELIYQVLKLKDQE